MHDKNLHLIDPDCKAQGKWTHVTMRAPLNGGGTTHKQIAGDIVYYNKVRHQDDSGKAVVAETGEADWEQAQTSTRE